MSIEITISNPSQCSPLELQALGEFFSRLGGRQALQVSGSVATEVITETPLASSAPEIPAAPSVSEASIPEVPAAPAQEEPTPSNAHGVDLDSAGLPWDGRIHSESKGKIGDGTWRKKRGVDPAVVTEVETRLRELVAIPAAEVSDIPPPTPVPSPSMFDAPPPPPPPAAPAVVTVADVFKFATAAEKDGSLPADMRALVLGELGFKSMVEIGARPDKAAEILQKFQEATGHAAQ